MILVASSNAGFHTVDSALHAQTVTVQSVATHSRSPCFQSLITTTLARRCERAHSTRCVGLYVPRLALTSTLVEVINSTAKLLSLELLIIGDGSTSYNVCDDNLKTHSVSLASTLHIQLSCIYPLRWYSLLPSSWKIVYIC